MRPAPASAFQPARRTGRRPQIGEEVQNDFAVAGGLENRTLLFEPFTQGDRIDQITVMYEADRAIAAIDDDGLGISFIAVAGGRITRMPDCIYPLSLAMTSSENTSAT